MSAQSLVHSDEIAHISETLLFTLPIRRVTDAVGIGCGSVSWWVADTLAALFHSGMIEDRLFVSGGVGIVAEDPEYAKLRPVLVDAGINLPLAHETEAEYMARVLLEAGIPHDRIVVENTSRNTEENISFCAGLGLFDRPADERPVLPARTAYVCAPYHSRRLIGTTRAFMGRALQPILTTIAAWPLGLSVGRWYRNPLALRVAREEMERLRHYTRTGHCLPVSPEIERLAFINSFVDAARPH